MSSQYKLKQEIGVLHVGGGRFFYPGEAYDLTDMEAVTYGHYFTEEQATVVEKDDKEDKTALDNDKIENVVIEMIAVNTEKVVDTVETEEKIEPKIESKTELEPSRNSRKASTAKAEK